MALAVLVACALLALPAFAFAYQITGTITDADSGLPIYGATAEVMLEWTTDAIASGTTDIAGAYIHAARLIDAAGCRDVALVAWWNGYEYPLWALAAGRGRPRERGSRSLRRTSPRASAVPITTHC